MFGRMNVNVARCFSLYPARGWRALVKGTQAALLHLLFDRRVDAISAVAAEMVVVSLLK